MNNQVPSIPPIPGQRDQSVSRVSLGEIAQNEQVIEAFNSAFPEEVVQKKIQQEIAFAGMLAKKNPKILNCSNESIISAVVMAAVSGLTLNPSARESALVPRGGQLVFTPMYEGVAKLVIEGGFFEYIEAGVVYQGDNFEYMLGTDGFIHHQPVLNRHLNTAIVAAWAKGVLPENKGVKLEIIDAHGISKRKAVAKSDKIWLKWPDEMAKKTAIWQLLKTVPKPGTLQRLFDYTQKFQSYEKAEISEHPDF